MREAIGGSLRRARTARRRTLREVSRRARVSLGYLSEVERGRKEPSSELLAAICEALDITLSDLLGDAAETLAATLDVVRRPVGQKQLDRDVAVEPRVVGAPHRSGRAGRDEVVQPVAVLQAQTAPGPLGDGGRGLARADRRRR